MKLKLFKKATREEKIQKRVDSLFAELTSTIECEFTELETVQILNKVRILLAENLENKRQNCFSNITESNQKLSELNKVVEYLK